MRLEGGLKVAGTDIGAWKPLDDVSTVVDRQMAGSWDLWRINVDCPSKRHGKRKCRIGTGRMMEVKRGNQTDKTTTGGATMRCDTSELQGYSGEVGERPEVLIFDGLGREPSREVPWLLKLFMFMIGQHLRRMGLNH